MTGLVIPDKVGVEVGWRAWSVPEIGDVLLHSLVQSGAVWQPRQPIAATCDRRGHDPPDGGCSCGIYAAKTLAHLQEMRYVAFGDSVVVVGEVGLWGRVIAGTQGWRAQFAYPRCLLVPYAHWRFVRPLRAAYGIPIRLGNVFAKGETSDGHR